MSLPLQLNLGRKGETQHAHLRFQGMDIRSVEQLPKFLFLGYLDEATFKYTKTGNFFQRLTNDCVESWSARWQGATADSYVDVSWASDFGWNVQVVWYGQTLIVTMGYRNSTFEALFKIVGGEETIDKNPAKMPIYHVVKPKDKGLPNFFALPSGWMRALVIPLHTSQVREAIALYDALEAKSLYSMINGTIIMGRTSRYDRIVSRNAVSDLINQVYRLTGIFTPELPTPTPDGMASHRFHYCLVLQAGFADIPKLVNHFKPLMRSDIGLECFTTSLDIPMLTNGFAIERKDHQIRWYFDPHWHKMALGADNVNVASALVELDEALAEQRQMLMVTGFNSLDDAHEDTPEAQEEDEARDRTASVQDVVDEEDEDDLDINEEHTNVVHLNAYFCEKPLDLAKEGLALPDFKVILANAILNPFGPTLTILGYFDETEKEDNLFLLNLHPTETTIKTVGHFASNVEVTSQALMPLKSLFDEISIDVLHAPEMDEDVVKPLVRALYEADQDTSERTASLIENHMRDIYGRFDEEMSGHVALAFYDEEAIDRMVEITFNPDDNEREMVLFLQNWRDCVENVYGSNALQFDALLGFLGLKTKLVEFVKKEAS